MKKILPKILSGNFILSLVILALAVAVFVALSKITKKSVKNYTSLNDPKVTVIRRAALVGKIAVFFFAVMVISQINGINITSAVAGLGIASAIVGLALQDFLKDIIMGIHIISDKFFSVGDCVEYGGREGVVVGFTVKTTKIGDLEDHSVITVCNRNITEIRKLGKRLDIDVSLAYNEDNRKIAQAVKDITEGIKKIDSVERCEFKGIQSFGESAVVHRFRICCEPTRRADVRRKSLNEIYNGLGKAGISIPFNQIDVHLDK